MIFSVETELEFLLRIVLSIICGAGIGFERETRLITAGIRTHIIVSLGSALMMIISKYGFGDVLQSSNIGLDPSRIAAGIVTAVGFIGAGVIFVRNQTISGVTTAAGIWATVGIGMGIGSGMYIIGIVTTVLLVILQLLLHRNNRVLKPFVSIHVTLSVKANQDPMELIHTLFPDKRVKIMDFEAHKTDAECEESDVKLTILVPNSYSSSDIMKIYQTTPYVKHIDF